MIEQISWRLISSPMWNDVLSSWKSSVLSNKGVSLASSLYRLKTFPLLLVFLCLNLLVERRFQLVLSGYLLTQLYIQVIEGQIIYKQSLYDFLIISQRYLLFQFLRLSIAQRQTVFADTALQK